MATQMIGSSIKRVEDPRFITGKGMYTDDIKLPGMVHAAFVRSPYAHATISSIDVSAAQAMPGVVAVYTGQDMADAGVGSVPCGWLLPGLIIPPHPPIAVNRVRYVGEIVAVVLAENPYVAHDAAEAVAVDYDALPAVVDPRAAQGGPTVHDEAPDNVAFSWTIGDQAKTDAAFAQAHKVAKVELVNNRLIPNALEPRAAVARVEPTGDITLWMTSQNPHIHRLLIAAFILNLPEHKLRVIAPDVGGGFGSKIFVYPEEVIVVWAALQSGQPVKWNSTRRESYIADAHGRDHVTEGEMAFDEAGHIIGLRVTTWAGMGAYLSTFSTAIPTYLYGTLLSGQYPIPAIFAQVYGTFTNTVMVDAYRGAGRPEATFVVERLVDLGAGELGLDPAELRRRNFIAPSAFPFQTQVALQYDSGNYEVALDRALEKLNYSQLRAEQAAARQQGRYIGIGFSTAIEACGLAPSSVVGSLGAQAGQWESAVVRVHPTGKVTVQTGSHSHGQGHETTSPRLSPTAWVSRWRTCSSSTATLRSRPSAMEPTAAARRRSAAAPSPSVSRSFRIRSSASPPTCWRPRPRTSTMPRARPPCVARRSALRPSARSRCKPIWPTTTPLISSRVWRRRPSSTQRTSPSPTACTSRWSR